MDEVLVRRIIGVISLALIALLLSWWLPTPGLQQLQDEGERHVSIDLTKPDPRPQEWRVVRQQVVDPGTAAPPPGEAPSGASDAVEQKSGDRPHGSKDTVPSPQAGERAVDPRPEPRPDPQPGPAADAAPESRPKPEPKPEPKPQPAPPPPPTPVPSTPAGKVQVQAGAFSHLTRAESVRGRAALLGVNCRIAPVDTAKGTLYRVRCGPYAGDAAAQDAIRRLGAQGIAAAIVTGG